MNQQILVFNLLVFNVRYHDNILMNIQWEYDWHGLKKFKIVFKLQLLRQLENKKISILIYPSVYDICVSHTSGKNPPKTSVQILKFCQSLEIEQTLYLLAKKIFQLSWQRHKILHHCHLVISSQ